MRMWSEERLSRRNERVAGRRVGEVMLGGKRVSDMVVQYMELAPSRDETSGLPYLKSGQHFRCRHCVCVCVETGRCDGTFGGILLKHRVIILAILVLFD
jgi:hypothetical protein